jgi:HSP20 family protein
MFVLPHASAVLRTQRHVPRSIDTAASIARVFDHLFADVPAHAAPAPARTPALDVSETDSHYLLSFELPGASKAALKVSIDGRRVQIETVSPEAATPAATPAVETQATPATQAQDADKATSTPRALYRERTGARYARTVSLPQEVNSDASEARFEDGVLSLRLAKRRPDGARRLTVN